MHINTMQPQLGLIASLKDLRQDDFEKNVFYLAVSIAASSQALGTSLDTAALCASELSITWVLYEGLCKMMIS